MSNMFRALAATFALFLWMSTLVAPWLADLGEDMMCMTELEHSEQEAEGEELSMEWEETTFEDKVTAKLDADQWHIAHLVNVRLHERLDASRLLDPPDQRRL